MARGIVVVQLRVPLGVGPLQVEDGQGVEQHPGPPGEGGVPGRPVGWRRGCGGIVDGVEQVELHEPKDSSILKQATLIGAWAGRQPE